MKRLVRPDTRALRAKIAALRADAKRPRREKRRRRWGWLWLLLALLLLALLRLCSCQDAPLPVPEAPQLPSPGGAGPALPDPSPPEPADPRLRRLERPGYATPSPEPLPWVAAFRLQVAARSPRLAQCFVGVERPGALKWTAAVEPGSGRVSDHVLEATQGSDALTAAQRACVLAVLSDPPYALEADAARSTPSRVSIAIAF